MYRVLPLLLLVLLSSACEDEEKKPGPIIIYRPVDMAVAQGDNLVWAGSSNWGINAHHVWSIETGTLPPGMSLISNTNVFQIDGVCSVAGDYAFTLKLEINGRAQRTNALFRVAPLTGPLTIYSPAMKPGIAGSAYSFEIIATGGSNSGYSWAVTAGSLPPGLGISTGASTYLAGTPTTKGTYTFTLELTDSAANTTSATFTMEVVQILHGPA